METLEYLAWIVALPAAYVALLTLVDRMGRR
jgi:hypothetical protein